METIPTLHIIDSDYGLVSLDVPCIQSILYARILNAPLEINPLNSIKSCAFHTPPSLVIHGATIETFPNIITHLRKSHGGIDQALSLKQTSETLALKNLVTSKLKPVLAFLYWVEQRNCEDFTSRWFMAALPLPFNYAYVKRKKNEAMQLIEVLYPLDTDLEVIKEFVMKTATQCLSTLSTRLGKLNYFYGDKPTTIDVIVYGYIAPIIKLPFPSNEITSLLSMWPNLTEFVKRIDANYFPEVRRDVKYLKKEEGNRQIEDEVSYMAIFVLGVSATSLVLGFALKRGMISLSRFS